MGILDPLHAIEQRIENIPAEAVHLAKVEVLRLLVRGNLTSLIEEDPTNEAKYRAAIADIA